MRKSCRISSPQTLSRLSNVHLYQTLQMLQMRLHGFGVNAADVNELVVVAVDKVALEVEHIGKSSGEACAEIHPGAA